MTETRLELSVSPEWSNVRNVRERVGAVLGDYGVDVRVATMMTASELVENAIKYGQCSPEVPAVLFSLEARDRFVTICVVNGSDDVAGVTELQRRVDEVARADDPRELFLMRLRQLCLEPGESGRLGIYRIACEGEFRLQCTYARPLLKMTAFREFHD